MAAKWSRTTSILAWRDDTPPGSQLVLVNFTPNFLPISALLSHTEVDRLTPRSTVESPECAVPMYPPKFWQVVFRDSINDHVFET